MKNYKKPIVIAEIGCNHMGKMEIAKELIKLAKECGANYAKFQKRNIKELLTEEQYNSPHPEPWNSFGETYGKHREYLEFNIDQHQELKKYSENLSIGYATSVWDITSANEIIQLNPDFIKIPSACNTNFGILATVIENYNGFVHISLGMTTIEEEKKIISFFKDRNSLNRLILYSCTSGYPIAFDEVCLLEIERIFSNYSNIIKDIGFSGHHLGIAIDIAAYTLGANYLERHFTKDRTWKGTDHAASLEVSGLQKLTRDLEHTYSALQYKKNEILVIEDEQRKKLKYRKF